MENKSKSKWFIIGAMAVYCLIGVEIIIMISPFAIYFYSVYGPILKLLAGSELTSWSTEFFLPHMVFPDDLFIISLSYLQFLLVIGLVLFLSAAVPLYYGRFTKKGVVNNSFYSSIRHPQYLFLGISGLGLLLYWPRFIILFMYITMLFVYYLLARNEEWRMKQEHPKTYEEYMKRTPMFLPGEPGGKVFRMFFGWVKQKWLGIALLYVVCFVLSIFGAMGLRGYTVEQIPIIKAGPLTLVSVFPRPQGDLQELFGVLSAHEETKGDLQSMAQANMAYIMPGDFFLMALVTDKDRRFSDDMIERFPEILEWHQYKFRGGLGRFFRIFYNFVRMHGTIETDYDIERFVFVRVTDLKDRLVSSENIFDTGLKRKPTLLVDVDAYTHEILSVVKTSDSHKWGTMPMPIF